VEESLKTKKKTTGMSWGGEVNGPAASRPLDKQTGEAPQGDAVEKERKKKKRVPNPKPCVLMREEREGVQTPQIEGTTCCRDRVKKRIETTGVKAVVISAVKRAINKSRVK